MMAFEAIAGPPSRLTRDTFQSMEITLRLCLESVLSIVKARLSSGITEDIEAPTLKSIRFVLDSLVADPSVTTLAVCINNLKKWKCEGARILSRVSRLLEPLISPFIIFPLAGITLEQLFNREVSCCQAMVVAMIFRLQRIGTTRRWHCWFPCNSCTGRLLCGIVSHCLCWPKFWNWGGSQTWLI